MVKRLTVAELKDILDKIKEQIHERRENVDNLISETTLSIEHIRKLVDTVNNSIIELQNEYRLLKQRVKTLERKIKIKKPWYIRLFEFIVGN